MRILGKSLIDRDFKEIFTSEIVSISGGLLAGTMLLIITKNLEMLPGLFLLLPGFLEMHGNIFGSFAARLGALLHTHHIRPPFAKSSLLRINTIATIILLLFVSLSIGILAYVFNLLFFDVSSPLLIIISLIAAFIALLFELPLTIFTTLWLFKRGHDPDDIMGPYVTTVGDVISIISLFIAMVVISYV